MTAPTDVELTLYPGATFTRTFRWRPEGDDAQDFTGWSATLLVGPAGGRALHTFTSAPGGGITLGVDGLVTLALTAAQTAGLARGGFRWHLDLRAPDGIVTRLLRGRLVVVADVAVNP